MGTLGPHARLPLDVDLLEDVRGVSRLLGPLLLVARLLPDLDLLLAPALLLALLQGAPLLLQQQPGLLLPPPRLLQ